MPTAASDITTFEVEVRRLARQAEPTLYPAYQDMIRSSYSTGPGMPAIAVDTNRRTVGTGFPDLTVLREALCLNWIEVKTPLVSIDPLPSPDQARFDNYKRTLPHAVLTNGWMWILFEKDVETRRLTLPSAWLLQSQPLAATDRDLLLDFLRHIATLSPSAATSGEEAVSLLAAAAIMLNATVTAQDEADFPEPLADAKQAFQRLLQTDPAMTNTLTVGEFADALAQTTVFGYLLARIAAGNSDITPTSFNSLGSSAHPFLKQSLYALNSVDEDMEALLKGVLRGVCDMINRAAPMLSGPNGDWTNVAYVYEDFFAAYRPQDRFKFGVFYTPVEVTRYQVAEVARVLREDFGLSGINDPAVQFLDPACGTGTYLMALAEASEAEAQTAGLPVGTAVQDLFAKRVTAFEVSPGPACVAQARLAAWLTSRNAALPGRYPIFTVNTLAPAAGATSTRTGNAWEQNVGQEQAAGDQVKRDRPLLVVLGNPPWGRRDKNEFDIGGQNILADWSAGAAGARQSLYDLYVAFFQFAAHTLLDRPSAPPSAGIISFISNRTWLRGKPFSGMRADLRDRHVTAYITDLGGDSRAGPLAGQTDASVFAIQAGSAIATLAFTPNRTGTSTRYRRILGTRASKLADLTSLVTPTWQDGPTERSAPFALADWGALADAPGVPAYFSQHMPGVKTHRDHLVVDPNSAALLAQITGWHASADEPRRDVFLRRPGSKKPSKPNKRAKTVPDRLGYVVNASHLQDYRYRPLDNRTLYADKAFITEPGQITRHYQNDSEAVCLLTLDSSSAGAPLVIATNKLPDYHSVRGSYGSHVLPLALPDDGMMPRDALSAWARAWADSMNATAEHVGCYLLALGNTPTYLAAYGDAIRSEPVRLPATADPALFAEIVAAGTPLLAAWTLQSAGVGAWNQAAAAGTPLGQASIEAGTVTFANGDRLTGLHPAVETLEVSTYPILERFLEARRESALSTPLAVEIRKIAGSIGVILNAQPACDTLLARAIAASTWPGSRTGPRA